MKRCGLLLIAFLFCQLILSTHASATELMRIDIDATDIARKLLQAQLEIPIEAQPTEHKFALWYPKWVPGSHGPGGPIANVAGLRIEDSNGNILKWERTPGEVYRLEVTVPSGVDRLRIWIRYITNQPTTGSMGHDSWGSPRIGVITPSTILLYPENVDINAQQIAGTIKLPPLWSASTALNSQKADSDSATLSFKAATLSQFVDSPIMCGLYREVFDLVETDRKDSIPPHRLSVFADTPPQCMINAEILARYRKMVTQTALLTGSHPFDQFDILLAVTNTLPPNGLEHSRSTFNVLPPHAVQSLDRLRGWDRLLVPHEYLHAWCGKYRRPAGMVTPNFHQPLNTDLLWVYEGLTQYLGELVEVRCGLMNDQQFENRLLVELQNATHQQGRTVAYFGLIQAPPRTFFVPAASHGPDFAEAKISTWKACSSGLRPMQSFEKKRMAISRSTTFVTSSFEQPATQHFRSHILAKISCRSSIRSRPYDWDGLILRRVESFQNEFDPNVASLLGYKLEFRP